MSQTQVPTPREEPADLGYFDYQARQAFRDLQRLHGFEEARRLMAEIINDEAKGRRQ